MRNVAEDAFDVLILKEIVTPAINSKPVIVAVISFAVPLATAYNFGSIK